MRKMKKPCASCGCTDWDEYYGPICGVNDCKSVKTICDERDEATRKLESMTGKAAEFSVQLEAQAHILNGLLSAKNTWQDRATAAELQNSAMRRALELADHSHTEGCMVMNKHPRPDTKDCVCWQKVKHDALGTEEVAYTVRRVGVPCECGHDETAHVNLTLSCTDMECPCEGYAEKRKDPPEEPRGRGCFSGLGCP